MNPELLAAIKERIDLGYSHEQIKGELQAAGYDESTVEAAYAMAQGGDTQAVSPIPTAGGHSASLDGTVDLPSATTLLKNGIVSVQTKLNWVMYLAAPLLVISVLDYLAEHTAYGSSTSFELLGSGVAAIALVVYVLHLAAVLYVVSQAPLKVVGYSEALGWARKHFWRLIWLYVLTFLVVWGGLVLLIIPGIIVGVYIYFSQYILAVEEVGGMSALYRSRELVAGNWSKIFGRLVIIALEFFLIFLFLGLGIGLASALTTDSDLAEFFLNLGFEVVGAAVSIISLFIGMEVYRYLAAARPIHTTPTVFTGAWKYKTLAFLGLTFPVVVIGISLAGVAFTTALNESRAAGDSAALRAQMVNVQVQAELYFDNANLSYLGVCAEIEPLVSYAESTECNEGADSYAFSGTVGTDTWCVDDTGYSKIIQAPLKDRTSCLEIPVFENDASEEQVIVEQLEEIMNQWDESESVVE